MRLAGLSIDVDSVASHLQGYGIEAAGDNGSAYRLAIPRALEILDRQGARATFFLIGEEARRHPEVVREIAERGHEVASHSMTHRLPFTDLGDERLRLEVASSKTLLEGLAGIPVVGFRAPSWDLSPRLLGAIAAAGYRYDASAYPSVLLPLLRLAVGRRSPTGKARTGSGLWSGVFGPTRPHPLRAGDRTLVEVPLCTAPWTRLPYYHSMRFLLPGAVFRAIRAATHLRRGPVTYQLHAVDFLGLEEDGLDPRLARHPGMGLALAAKLDAAGREISYLAARRRVVPLAEIAASRLGGTQPPAEARRESAA